MQVMSTTDVTTHNQTEQDECILKMGDIPFDPIVSAIHNEQQTTNQINYDCTVSAIEPQSLKRQHSMDMQNEGVKRQRTTEEIHGNFCEFIEVLFIFHHKILQ